MNRRGLKKTILGILAEDNYNPEAISVAVLKYDLNQEKLSFNAVCRAAAVACEIKRDQMLLECRKPKVVLARSLVYRYYRGYKMTFEKIGSLFSKHHATIHNGVKTLRNLLEIGDKESVAASLKFYELVNKNN